MDASLLHDVFRMRLRIASCNYLWAFRVYADESAHLQIQRLDASDERTAASSRSNTLPFQPFCVPRGCNVMHLGWRGDTSRPRVYACRFDLAKRREDGSVESTVRVTGSLSPSSGFQAQLHPTTLAEWLAFAGVSRALQCPVSWTAAVEPVRVKMAPFSNGKYTLEGTVTDGSQIWPVVVEVVCRAGWTLDGVWIGEKGTSRLAGTWIPTMLFLTTNLEGQEQRIRLHGELEGLSLVGNWIFDHEAGGSSDSEDRAQDDENEGKSQSFLLHVTKLGRLWSPRAHPSFPTSFRDAVELCLLSAGQYGDDALKQMPSELWIRVFEFCDSEWFTFDPGRKLVNTTSPMMINRVSNQLHRLYRFWLSLQIELRGRYSLARLDSLVAHAQESRPLLDVASVLLVPIPSIVVVLAIDALPLNPPTEQGIRNQTVGLHVRVFATVYLVTTMIVTQIHQSAPTLPMSRRRLALISAISGLIGAGCFYSLGLVIGFPTPFVMQLVTGPWAAALAFLLWLSWRHHLSVNHEARASLHNYLIVFAVQVVIIFIYSGYNILFTSAPTSAQTYMTLMMPMIKLLVKNMVASGLVHMEDLAPAMVVFNIDVFHGMFVSSTTQQAASINSTVVVIVTDALFLLIAFSEVYSHIRHIDELGRNCHQLGCGVFAPTVSDLPAAIKRKSNVVDYALAILQRCPNIRNHEKFRQRRHELTQGGPLSRLLHGSTLRSIVPQALHAPVPVRIDTMQVQYVARVLELLRTIEFYVLIEFVEFIIATFYTVYIVAITHAPNRVYYSQFKQLSHDEMAAIASRVGVYASLELVSFVLICCVMNCKLAPLSAIQQLAFVLQTHWKVVHAAMLMWIILTVQLTFEHYGTDYSFSFKWLRNV